MTAQRIRADYEALIEIAQAFNREADKAGTLNRFIRSDVAVLQQGDWVGKSADEFYLRRDCSTGRQFLIRGRPHRVGSQAHRPGPREVEAQTVALVIQYGMLHDVTIVDLSAGDLAAIAPVLSGGSSERTTRTVVRPKLITRVQEILSGLSQP